MNSHGLVSKQQIQRPLKEVFQFFEQPENLELITPPWLEFRILTPRPITMRKGLQITYTVSPLKFPMRWVSKIESYDPPYRFVDVQVEGPYRLWRHTHRFHDSGSGTLVEDEVEYALPFGLLGRLAHSLFVRRQLESIFRYRESVIAKTFK
jgi:ligand-binding SRPBCC domain-containing protein